MFSVKFLRYYERLGILKPVYVNPKSKFRYYDLKQTCFVEIIRMAIEMDVPFKELHQFISDEDIDFKSFADFGRELINKKMKVFQRALKLYDFFNEQWVLQESYLMESIYTRNIDKMLLYYFL